jgi:hypothetical protein
MAALHTSAPAPGLSGMILQAEAGLNWPEGPLEAFSLRMASHGHSVSSFLMLRDRAYAMDQLAHAHSMADVELRGLAMRVFQLLETSVPHLSRRN